MKINITQEQQLQLDELLKGLYWSKPCYFKYINGKPKRIKARGMVSDILGISPKKAKAFLASQNIKHKEMPRPVRVPRVKKQKPVKVKEPKVPKLEPPVKITKRRGPSPKSDDEKEEEAFQKLSEGEKNRYCIVQQGQWFGIYNTHDAATHLISKNKNDVISYINKLKRSKDAWDSLSWGAAGKAKSRDDD